MITAYQTVCYSCTVVELFTDASVRYSSDEASIAFVARNNGEELFSSAHSIDATEPVIAEFKAIVQALQTVRDRLGNVSVTVYTDCHSIVSMVNGIGTPSRDDLHGFVWWINRFEDVSVEYIRREDNRTAHRLARQVTANQYESDM